MSVFAVYLVAFLAMTRYSSGSYCVCNSGVSDAMLQKSIDYACGNGADCTQIQQNGPCYNPNTVKNHCDYAVNSYYQKKGQVADSCDFSKTATVSQTPPPGQSSTCVYPASASSGGTTPSTGGSTTPPGGSTTPPGGSTAPPGGTTGGGTTGGGTTGGGTTGGGTTGGGTTGGTTGGNGTTGGGGAFAPPSTNPAFGGGGGLGPSGTGMNTDNGSTRLLHQSGNAYLSFILPLLFSCFVWLKI